MISRPRHDPAVWPELPPQTIRACSPELRDCAKRAPRWYQLTRWANEGLSASPARRASVEMLTMSETKICSVFVTSDTWRRLRADQGGGEARAGTGRRSVDQWNGSRTGHGFIAEHTHGFAPFAADLRAESWPTHRARIWRTARRDRGSGHHLCPGRARDHAWGMGLTQHKHSVQTIADADQPDDAARQYRARRRGPVPRSRPLQCAGNRTVGIEEQPTGAFLDKLGAAFGFNPPREHRHTTLWRASRRCCGEMKVFIASRREFCIGYTPIPSAPGTPCAHAT